MTLVPRLRARLQALFRKRRLDAEMLEEMRLHLEQRIDERMAEGMPREQARSAALRAFGPLVQVQEQCREQRGWTLLEHFARDLAQAFRWLRASPGFTAVALISLALGIGANTAVFSLVKSVLLNPLPYPHGDRLVSLWVKQRAVETAPFSWPEFLDYQSRNRTFDSVAAYRLVTYVFTRQGEPEQLSAAQVSASMFTVLGLTPQLGRVFTADEDRPKAPGMAVLSDALWRRRFSADPNVLGRVLSFDNTPFQVIGVLPADFTAFASVDFVTQVGRASNNGGWDVRTMRPSLYGLGRLKSGVTVAQALADLARVGALLARLYPQANGGSTAVGQLLFDKTVGAYRRGLWLLLGAVSLVLLIACANLANLLLARGASRESEVAVRAALGAARSRIISECLAESALVALGGGALGVLLAFVARRGIIALSPPGVERFQHAGIDATVLAVAFGATLLTALLFGGWPACRAARTDLRAAMAGSRTISSSRGVVRAREVLIVAEVGLTFVLLSGAGLLLKSLAREHALNLGFQTQGVLTARVKVPWVVYDSPEKLLHFNQSLLENLAAVDGVQSAAFGTSIPLAGVSRTGEYFVDGFPEPAAGQAPTTDLNIVSSGYFDALGIPVVLGRDFGEQDRPDSPFAAVVDREFAARYWNGTEAIGKTIRVAMEAFIPAALVSFSEPPANRKPGAPPTRSAISVTIVGIVPAVHLYGYASEPRLPQIYLSDRQTPANYYFLAVKSSRTDRAFVERIRQAVQKVDGNQPISEVRMLDDYLSSTYAASRLYTFLLAIFAGLALLLAAVGLYGVLAYQVNWRRREFGIRLALGGRASQITALVVGRGLRLVAAGFSAGLFGALLLGRLLSALLYHTSAFDPAVLAAVATVLIAVSMLASWLPSRRAVRIAPSETLRAQ